MTEIIRHCPDCGQDRPFEQHHGTSGLCRDADGWDCPEWYCLSCGAVLLIGDVPAVANGIVPNMPVPSPVASNTEPLDRAPLDRAQRDSAPLDRAVLGRTRVRALSVGIRDRVA